ncbi:hypothetical protein [Sorangium sp. So ce1099]|uniref:hypothetical protein n=1 Tax=Sorangium sp. So ce1099 TaxID=3133331 RepID=UPI003F5F2B31
MSAKDVKNSERTKKFSLGALGALGGFLPLVRARPEALSTLTTENRQDAEGHQQLS